MDSKEAHEVSSCLVVPGMETRANENENLEREFSKLACKKINSKQRNFLQLGN